MPTSMIEFALWAAKSGFDASLIIEVGWGRDGWGYSQGGDGWGYSQGGTAPVDSG